MADAGCPVCGLAQVPENAAQCPQCDADLTCFAALDALSEVSPSSSSPVPPSPAQPRHGLALAVAGLFALGILVLLGMQVWVLDQVATRLGETETGGQARTQESRLDELERRVDALSRTGAPADEQNEPAFVVHEVKAGQTRWAIAEQYYGSGQYYPVLLEHNEYLAPGPLEPGRQIRVLGDARLARETYHRHLAGGRWISTVRDGDTLGSIAARFCPETPVDKLARLNPGLELTAGQRVEVFLQ